MAWQSKPCAHQVLFCITDVHSNHGTEVLTIGVGVGENVSLNHHRVRIFFTDSSTAPGIQDPQINPSEMHSILNKMIDS
jgi:hypothetical protein